MLAYIHTKHVLPDGQLDTLCTIGVDAMEKPLWWQEKGLSFTSSGYGSRIPTRYMVRLNGRWRRVYCAIYSNSGTLFIGRKLNNKGQCAIVQVDHV
jgi:hypothetical protein